MSESVFDGSLRFRVKLGVLLAALVSVLVAIDVSWVHGGLSGVNTPEARGAVFSFFLAASAAAIAMFGALYAKQTFDASERQLERRHADYRVARSFEFLRVIDEPQRMNARALLVSAIKRVSPEEPLDQIIPKSVELERAVVGVLGTFEDIALAIRAGYADERVLFISINHIVVTLHGNLRPYIAKLRSGHAGIPGSAFANELYAEFQTLAESWARNESVVTKEPLRMTAA